MNRFELVVMAVALVVGCFTPALPALVEGIIWLWRWFYDFTMWLTDISVGRERIREIKAGTIVSRTHDGKYIPWKPGMIPYGVTTETIRLD